MRLFPLPVWKEGMAPSKEECVWQESELLYSGFGKGWVSLLPSGSRSSRVLANKIP